MVCLNPVTRGKEKLSVWFWELMCDCRRFEVFRRGGSDCSRWSFMRLKLKHFNDINSRCIDGLKADAGLIQKLLKKLDTENF